MVNLHFTWYSSILMVVTQVIAGIVQKYVNFGNGWRARLFVLENGVLKYYKVLRALNTTRILHASDRARDAADIWSQCGGCCASPAHVGPASRDDHHWRQDSPRTEQRVSARYLKLLQKDQPVVLSSSPPASPLSAHAARRMGPLSSRQRMARSTCRCARPHHHHLS
jgi:hypothetical protein